MKFFLIVPFLILSGALFAQKEKIEIHKKTGVVSVDGTPTFTLEGQQMGNTQILKNLNGERLAVFQIVDYYDSKHISNSNSQGRVVYFDVTFLNENMDKCEIPVNGLKKQLAKYIVDYNLVRENALDPVAVKQFVTVHGTKFSEEKNRSTTVIIVR